MHNSAAHRRVRQLVLARDHWRCWRCGGYADTCDYIVPLGRGGQVSVFNGRAACATCNSRGGGELTGGAMRLSE